MLRHLALLLGATLVLAATPSAQAGGGVIVTMPDTTQQQAARQRRQEAQRREAQAVRKQAASEREERGWGEHRQAEAERFVQMRNAAEQARGMRFDPPDGSKPPRNCRKVPVTRHGRAIAESEAAAEKRMRETSRARCGGTLGGVSSEGATSCGVWDSGRRLVSKGDGRFERKQLKPVRYECSHVVQCVKQEEVCDPTGTGRVSKQ
ncbi:hypothetical protein [Zeimonas arvi]|uniref:Secreted protein n=1 Tax=Zeimonas arvi TaxID=2498847 RepID=A0A5C8NW70_9BURK|nr:hypothetical protein [Zeimonas arvi]TXL65302.1 hypothetical protein FHP08_10940 [Zeimonas arvi]